MQQIDELSASHAPCRQPNGKRREWAGVMRTGCSAWEGVGQLQNERLVNKIIDNGHCVT